MSVSLRKLLWLVHLSVISMRALMIMPFDPKD